MKFSSLNSFRLSVMVVVGLVASLLGAMPGMAQDTGSSSNDVTSLQVPTQSEGIGTKSAVFSAKNITMSSRTWGVVQAYTKAVMGIPVSAGGLTPLVRAQRIARRMQKLYQTGARFREDRHYVVGKLNGETVLALRAKDESTVADLLFTIDSNMFDLINKNNKRGHVTYADIAKRWRDILIRSIEVTDIAGSLGHKVPEVKSDDWINIPPGYGADMELPTLDEKDIRRSGP